MQKIIPRDISWLAFNGRVLQEAADPTVPLRQRINFLGIFSNNRDEFFRVRVASLKRMLQIEAKSHLHVENNPQKILKQIHRILDQQQEEFDRVWDEVQEEMHRQHCFIRTERQLNARQRRFIRDFFDTEISPNIIPILIQDVKKFPDLRDKSLFLGVVMVESQNRNNRKYAVIEVPATAVGRFIQLPSNPGQHDIILLEDAIKFNLPEIFGFLGYDEFHAHIFKFTRDAELDIDNSDTTSVVQKLEKGLKNRKKGKPVRLTYDEQIDKGLLEYLIQRLGLSSLDNLTPGDRIHNFRHFMDFPDVFSQKSKRRKGFEHPLLVDRRISDVIMERDVLLSFPYHSFNPSINLIREAAFDPSIISIKVTCYRLAPQSKIINALINAVRNGKDVTVMIELKARFDEKANLEWKQRLEDAGVKVLTGIPEMKVHSKLCVIKKRIKNKTISYGFVSTGNLNEKTAKIYGDHALFTSNKKIMDDVNRIFTYLEQPKGNENLLAKCKTVIPSPNYIRDVLEQLIDAEIVQASKGKPAEIIAKMNSLSDVKMITKLYDAARAGVTIKLIVRGIFCMLSENKKFVHPVRAISIVDEYLEHARVWVFHNKGNKKVYISSADWMLRNIEHRVEASCPVTNKQLKQELIDILNIQLADNVKARILDNDLGNKYVSNKKTRVRSQEAIYNYLIKKTYDH
ncbi:MAG: polyphosphate kinase 1 [Niabella sp.]